MARLYFKDLLSEEEITFAEQWIAALRSGDYEQGPNTLRSAENKYCCLGVAAELSPLYKAGFTSGDKSYEYECYLEKTNVPHRHCLSNSYTLGLRDGGGRSWTVGFAALANLNDDLNCSFDQIADILELDLNGSLTLERYKEITSQK